MRLFTAGFLAALNCSVFAQSPAKRPMTFADLQAMKRVSDPQVSPSGKWVLFSVTDVSLEKNTKTNHLWVVPLDGSAKEHQLTTGSGESNGRFSPDGKWISYTAEDRSLIPSGRSQIFLATWDEKMGGLKGEGSPATHGETDADGAIWSPDSQHILYVSDVYPDCESHVQTGAQRNSEEWNCNAARDLAAENNPVKAQVFDHLLYRHWNAYTGLKRSHIFYLDVFAHNMIGQPLAPTDLTPASVVGDHEAPTAFPTGGPLGYAISPDGKEVAYVVNLDKVPAESTNNDIFTLQLDAEPSTAKKVSTSPGSDDGPQYSPDGKWLAWRSQARAGFESDKFDLVIMDRAKGEIRNLTTKFGNWVDAFVWAGDSKQLWFSSPRHGQEALFRTNATGDDLHPMAKGSGEWGDFTARLVSGREHVIGTRMWVDRPTEVFDIDAPQVDHSAVSGSPLRVPSPPIGQPVVKLGRGAGPLTGGGQLTHLNDELILNLALSPLEPFAFLGAHDTEVEGFLIRPPNFDPSKKYPLKFLIHGGPQGAWGDGWSYRWNPELFAANGYVVVMINPRGSTGYGQQFVDEVSGDWGGRPYIDLMKGLDYAEKTYPFIDKTRECALGASYGGFMANWILTHTDRFQCIVSHDGMYNPQAAFGTTEELWFNEWEFRPMGSTGPDAVVEQTKPAHPWDFYGRPASEDPFRKWSPMMFIDKARTPTLVIHSQKDYRLDVSEGFQLFTALQLRNIPSKMLYFPDEGHWVMKPQNSQLWYETVNDWVDRWTHTNKYETK